VDHDTVKSSGRRLAGLDTWGTLLVALLLAAPAHGHQQGGQPRNDELRRATVIRSLPFTDLVDTTTATSHPRDPSLSCNDVGGYTDGKTVWYVWRPTENMTVNISTVGSTRPGGGALDTVHGVFVRHHGNLAEIACVDVVETDDLTFQAVAGDTYYLKFGEYLDGVGGGNLVVTVTTLPPLTPLVLESVRDGVSDAISNLVAPSLPGAPPVTATGRKSKALQIIDGAETDDTVIAAPPDTNGDVGRDHYVQMINKVTTIFDKSGNRLFGPFPSNVFWTGLGGLCETTNRGDPIVLYDEETDRWLVSQFAFETLAGPWSLCIAMSHTADPTGAYVQHEFDFTGIGFPDYPKYGFVTGAIGVMVHLFFPFQGAGLGAIDKAEALSGGPTTMVFFKLGGDTFGYLPGDNDGPVFDNMPPTFVTANNGNSGRAIDFWEIHPDFDHPADSTIGQVARIVVRPYDSDLCTADGDACIPQPEGAPALDALSDFMMHRLQLRDFGGEKRAVVNHTVDVDGTGKAGIRWYEFRNHGDRGWKLKTAGTFSPDGDYRWMGGIAMTARGDLCLGYSISSTTTYPSIGVAGRRGDSRILNVPELVVFDGNIDQHVQLDVARWGDYSAMTIDPVDDTCWYTQEYAKPNSVTGERFGWATKIIQFEFRERWPWHRGPMEHWR
jgi:hypothetical protein